MTGVHVVTTHGNMAAREPEIILEQFIDHV